MKKGKIAAIALAVIVIGAAAVLWTGSNKGRQYSRQQAAVLAAYDVDALYGQLSDNAKNEYKTIEDFFDNFVYHTDFEENIDTSGLELMASDGKAWSSTKTYLYQLRRQTDSTEGYLIGITVSGLPFSPKVDALSYQEADIMLKAGEQD